MITVTIDIDGKKARVTFDAATLKEEFMATAVEIRAKVNAMIEDIRVQTTKIDNLNTLMDNMRSQIADLLANSGVPVEVSDAVDALFAGIQAEGAAIDIAMNENLAVEVVPESAAPATP